MTVRKTQRQGKPRLIIDIVYRKPDGSKGRYRRDAQVQTVAAARAEERRLLAHLAQFGELPTEQAEPKEASTPAEAETPEREQRFTFGDAVTLFREGKALTKLKPSTRQGYEEILTKRLLPKWKDRSLDTIDFSFASSLDAELVKEELSPSRRRNVQIVIRSVLRAAVDASKLPAMPKLPDLPKKGKKALLPLTRSQVEAILAASPKPWRLAFGLAAFAGLRAGEVRALRGVDLDAEAGVIIVRHSTCKGVTSTPKSGHEREVPIAEPLLDLLHEAGPVLPTRSSPRRRTASPGASPASFRRSAAPSGKPACRASVSTTSVTSS
ncbi:site-specific integrase [Polyangium sp. 6x1]|uniref:tyrosine-type recombinase/integrase n=1 Tax=Polyangium sp. 6x1 TaxID=3042689 RepID=UPI0024830C5E|nr:site-specific integrase [Polyangium sp. 6x1]MDI1450145.1 site-specific integrase [Polyangium sp. 6x1]